MSLLDVREQFARTTGRYDLVTSATTFTDNGADFYIKAGQRMLDRMLPFGKDQAEVSVSLATSAIETTLANVLTVLSVAVRDTGDDTIQYLDKTNIENLREVYGDENSNLSNVTSGEPRSWALGWIRDAVTDNTTTAFGSVKLVTMPPADKSYTLVINARVKSNALVNDTDESFWTEEHPDVLVMAAQYVLEGSYRNAEGAAAARQMVERAVEELYNDVVEQMQVDSDRLADSHRFIDDVRAVRRSVY